MCEGEKVLPESLVDGFIPGPTDPDFKDFSEYVGLGERLREQEIKAQEAIIASVTQDLE